MDLTTNRRRWAGALAAAAVVGLGVSVVGSSSAAAIDKTLNYDCVLPVIGQQTLPVTLKIDLPAVTANQPAQAKVVAEVGVPANVQQALGLVGATQTDLSATLHTTWSGTVTGTVDGTLAVTNSAPANGVWTIAGPAQYPAITATAAGDATLTAGNIDVVLTPKDAKGAATALGTSNVPCTLGAGQDATILKVTVA